MECKWCQSPNIKLRNKKQNYYLCLDCKRHFKKDSNPFRGLIVDGKKHCSKCNEQNPIEEFYQIKDGSLRSKCKSCFNTYQNSTKYKKYGLSKEQFDLLLQESKFKCNIYDKDFSDKPFKEIMSRLVIDHSHQTNEVRGMLCSDCNSLLGFCKDNTTTLLRAIAYLEKV